MLPVKRNGKSTVLSIHIMYFFLTCNIVLPVRLHYPVPNYVRNREEGRVPYHVAKNWEI